MRSFSPTVYRNEEGSNLYNFMDALIGDGGVGTLKKQLLLARLSQSLDTTYFSDLDDIFGTMTQLTRFASESYSYNPSTDILTSDQWDEIQIKDSWYRARIKMFFKAIALGGSPDGLRLLVKSAISADCDIYEMWKFTDGYISYPSLVALSQTGGVARNEIIIRAHKNLATVEQAQLRALLRRLAPVDSIVTLVGTGVTPNLKQDTLNALASSTYYVLEPYVTGGANSTLDASLEPNGSYRWVQEGQEVRAPQAAFNASQEFSQYFTVDTGNVDSVTYSSEDPHGGVFAEDNYKITSRDVTAWTPWIPYQKADSPDNYPGGKYGIHPDQAPALTIPAQRPYTFGFQSQQEYIDDIKRNILESTQGRYYPEAFQVAKLPNGETTEVAYRLPLKFTEAIRKVWTPDMAVAAAPPAKPSSVSSPWFNRISTRIELPVLPNV
jgi:hypothetical protein